SQKLCLTTSLNEYLREVAGLKGTKVMCREAGCGCCSVTVSHLLPDSDKLQTYSVQSCLTPLYAVDDWQISTVEGIGSQKVGFHPIQERIAKFNGTQCGYCTPGMVMNMYGLLHQNPNITTQEIEDNFDGNICRCTGYRSILDAMKSFSTDGNIPGAKPVDIEDLNKHLCPRTGEPCTGHQEEKGGKRNLDIEVNGSRWYRPTSLKDLGKLLKDNVNKKVKMIFGNTSTGIFKNEEASDIYIDLHRVEEIYCYQLSDAGVTFGAATSLTNLMNKLKADQDKAGFHYFSAVVRHLKFIGNVMVRNAGSIAGNLMIKHKHPDFPSDIFTVLEALGAKVDIFDADTSTTATYTML
uniref:FAD-binding PCMH-type domain-containing protein n=1 Tax=Biomphalaria glabrata TaxID=6526 RepID=A0A2C9JQ57_BIOGL